MREKSNKKIEKGLYGAGTAILILCILAFSLWKNGIYPFGDKTLVYNDMQYQYMDFFMWFYRVLHGEDSLIYSFSFGLGGNVIALVAYYLASPLNLLCYFWDVSQMAEFLTALICLKLLLCGVSLYIYLLKRFQILPLYAMLLGISYGLMGYNLLQCANIMWLDGVIILPFLALGISNMVWKNKYGVYFAALFYGIFTNWYIGYMLCIFAVLYFIFESILYYFQHKFELKYAIINTVKFGCTSILSLLATGILFVPQVIYMMQEGEEFDWSIFKPDFGFSFLAGFRDLYLEPDKLNLAESNPPIYVGSVVFICIAVFFVSKKIKPNLKYLMGIFLAGFMFICNFRPLNYIFTLFKIPSSHTYRYVFLFSFFLIVAAALCIKEINNITAREIRTAIGIILALGLLLDYIHPFTDQKMFYLGELLLLIIGISLSFMKGKRRLRCFSVIIVCCLCFELAIKSEAEFADHNFSASQSETYNNKLFTEIKNNEYNEKFYRIDKTYTRYGQGCNNESMGIGYSSISNYSSANNISVSEFLKNMGYTSDLTAVPYTPILPIDSLLGVKYIYSSSMVPRCNAIEKSEENGIILYENPYALSLGYSVENISDGLVFEDNAMENHNILFERIVGRDVNLYSWGDILSVATDYTDNTEWQIQVTKSGPVYVYFSNGQFDMQIFVNDNLVARNSWYDNSIRYLGEYEAGETITLKVNRGNGYYVNDYGLNIATLDLEELEECMSILEEGQLEIVEWGNTELLARYSGQENSRILLTLPYENGWEVFVNGVKVSYHKLYDTFIGIDVDGPCEIKMVFNLPGKELGIILSLLGLSSFLIWQYLPRKNLPGLWKK